MPDFYAEKVNLFVALTPIGITLNVASDSVQKTAPKLRLMQLAVEKFGAYKIVGVNWWQEEALVAVCGLFEGFCEAWLQMAADADPNVDNMHASMSS